MIQIPVQNCCGCTACLNICPRSAIDMKADQEGFFYPTLDEVRCVQCGLCEQVCPIINPPELSKTVYKCVVARSNDSCVLNESTSGGFVDALCECVIKEYKGYVCGVSFDAEFMPVHEIVNTREETKRFRNSKYAQSVLANTYAKVGQLLCEDKYVLFIGVPCQVAGLKAFLREDYEKLFTVDLVCRSIPSPKLWREYIKWQEQRYHSKVFSVSCRKKTYGYHSGALEICFASGKCYTGSNRVDYFMKCFHRDVCSRPSCYSCHFKDEHRCSDFTVFDSWNPEDIAFAVIKDDDCGYSNVIVHTKKGRDMLESMNNITAYDADMKKMLLYTGGMESRSIERTSERDNFYKDLEMEGFQKTVERYAVVSRLDRTIEKIKPFRYFLKRCAVKLIR